MAQQSGAKHVISDGEDSEPEQPSSKRIKKSEPDSAETNTARIKTLVKKDLSSDREKIVLFALRKLFRLSSVFVCRGKPAAKKNAETIVHMLGHFAMVKAIEKYQNSKKIQLYGLMALSNVSYFVDEPLSHQGIDALGGIELTLSAMERFPAIGKVQAAGCILLGNLCGKSAYIAKQVAESLDGVQLILNAMKAFQSTAHVQSNGCYALTRICRHEDQAVIRRVVEAGGRVAVATAAEKHPDHEKVQKNARAATKYLWGF